jgi:hypothetical protein
MGETNSGTRPRVGVIKKGVESLGFC